MKKRNNDYKTYFILNCTTQSDVKIGKSCNPAQRLQILQPGNHCTLEVVAVIEGDHERELHSRFKAYHVSREWFSYEGELKEYIESLKC